MKYWPWLVGFFSISIAWGQCDSVIALQWQNELQQFYLGEKSPIPSSEKKEFSGISFFTYRPELCFTATFQAKKKQPFVFATSSGKEKTYQYIGDLSWHFQGEMHQLPLFEGGNQDGKWFFLPFSDLTNGAETYGGGRYVELPWKKIKNGQNLTLDFNRAYFPYCAYTTGYACPLVPDISRLNFPVTAGVKWAVSP